MKKFLFIVIAFALVSSSAFAAGDADIYGTVLLPDGSAIPGVAITLSGDVGGTKTAVTSEEGNFRFLKLPPGNYELKFELEGFKTVIRKNIRLFVGKNITLNVPMETTTIKEEIIITERPGVIDTRRTQVGVNVTDEMIKSLPTARNPWTVMNLVPGVLMDREDVGGAESGQQSAYQGHGGHEDDSTWTIDGANITDPSAIGAAPAYLNINAYEELQVTIGSTDITAQTGGVQLNFVSKRGGNRFSGDFHLYIEDEKWEMTQTPPQYFLDQGWESPGIQRLYQYGINFGGPIIKDKMWFYGSYAIQDIHARTPIGDEDATWLVSGYFKASFQLGNTSGELHYSHDAKLKWGRTDLSRAQQDAGTLFDQTGPGNMYMAQFQHVMGNLMLNVKGVMMDGGFRLDPRGADIDTDGNLKGLDFLRFESPQHYGGANIDYNTNRDTLNLSLDGNYFAENILGGDHEIRFGVDYYTGTTTTTYLYPNQRYGYVYAGYGRFDGTPAYGLFFMMPNYLEDETFTRISFYLSDTATFGKLTASLGIRYDKEGGKLNETPVEGVTWWEPGHAMHGVPVFTTEFTNFTIQGAKSPQTYEVISPRLSLSYDITGDGKNVIKATVARYGSQSGNALMYRHILFRWGLGVWYDTNNDEQIGWDELLTGVIVSNGLDYNSATGWKNVTTASDFNSPLLDELALTFEKALAEDLAVSISGFYKKRHNQVDSVGEYTDGTLEYDGHWTQNGTYTFADGTVIPIWNRDARPTITHYRNYTDSYVTYMAAVLQLTKKFSNKWMLDASFTYSDWKQHWAEAEYENGDLSDFGYFDGGLNAPESGGSGLQGVFVNSRWQFKLSGLYQLPWGINITGVFQAREGYVLPYHESFYTGGGVGTRYTYLPDTKFGDDRLDPFWMLSMGLEKTFKISDTASATVFIDAYNLTNNATTLLVETNYTASNFDQPLRVLNPGIFQFGVRVSF